MSVRPAAVTCASVPPCKAHTKLKSINPPNKLVTESTMINVLDTKGHKLMISCCFIFSSMG